MRTLKTVSVVAALVLATGAPADARTRQVESFIRRIEVSIDRDGRVEKIEGVIDAKTDRCVDDRDVAVYADPYGASKLFGDANTDDDGSFEVRGDGASDVEYAIAVFRVRRDRLTCLGKGVVTSAGTS